MVCSGQVQHYEDNNDYDDDVDDSNNNKLGVAERLVFDILNNLNLGRYSH
jgi:hypothetical protein